jgi:hypothetical protein
MDSQGLSHDFGSRKHMNLYRVENEQENRIISDLKIICHRTERKIRYPTRRMLMYHHMVSVTGSIRSARHDGRKALSYPKICDLFFFVMS